MPGYIHNNVHFSTRVAGVILFENHVLLQGEPGNTVWTLPGGGVELLEPSEEALRREIHEELGVDIQVDRLLWITEEFYMINDHPHHQYSFYYLISLQNADYVYDITHSIDSVDQNDSLDIIFRWFKIDDLKDITIYPNMLQTALQALPATTEHRILVDDNAVVLTHEFSFMQTSTEEHTS